MYQTTHWTSPPTTPQPRSWGWALARVPSLLSCFCFHPAVGFLLLWCSSCPPSSQLTYSSVHIVLPRGSILFAFSLPKPISNFAHQNCPERVVLSSVSKSGTLSWTSQNIAAFAQSQLWSIRGVKCYPQLHTHGLHRLLSRTCKPQNSALWEVETATRFWQAISAELHTAEGTSAVLSVT